MLREFRAARYCFSATVLDDMVLPEYKGSTFRGAFGNVMRSLCCTTRNDECRNCEVEGTCPYAYMFETRVPDDSDRLRNIEDIPRPFIIEPPETQATFFPSGSALSFNFVLFGRGIDFLPYAIVAFREIGEKGIGRHAGTYGRRAKFRLDRADLVGFPPWTGCESRACVYDASTGVVHPQPCVNGAEIEGIASGLGGLDRLSLEFLTPTRLKYEHSYVERPEFHIIVRALLRRMSSLLYFHHGAAMEVDFGGLIERAKKVALAATTARWLDWTRYSSRQGERMQLGGIVGGAEYSGSMDEFAPLLLAGTLTHVGKNVTFGLGRYSLACRR